MFLFSFSGAAVSKASTTPQFVLKGADQGVPVTPQDSGIEARNLRKAEVQTAGEYREIPKRINHIPAPIKPAETHVDPLLKQQRREAEKTLQKSFSTLLIDLAGQYDTSVNPPDTVGDAGVDYYVQAVNAIGGSKITIYNKNTATVTAGPFDLDSLSIRQLR